MSYETADILDGAADVIERDGWHQGKEEGPGGSVCLVRALSRAALGTSVGWFPALDALKPIIGDDLAYTWNDAPERTKQEVLDALRLAAKRERCAADGIAS